MNNNNTVSDRHGSAVITLPSDTEILITRVFDAPADLIFKAWTTPGLVKRWWGFDTSEWLVCDIDLREGGQWRYVIRDDEMEVGFHGEYREIAGPHRLVSTEVYEGFPDPDGAAHRDARLASGMESGMQVSYDRLEHLVRQAA